MVDASQLDNPIWWALNSHHSALKRQHGLAARYPSDVSRLSGLAEPTRKVFADLQALTPVGETASLFTAEPVDVPSGWQVLRTQALEQMVCESLELEQRVQDVEALEQDNVPEMLALAAITEPGPFLSGTIRLGRYFGIRGRGNQLAAMAGERLRLQGFTEISAVCTDPAYRGRGYAGALVLEIARRILAEGSKPFLHVKKQNNAKKLYETLGFKVRRSIQLTVLKRG